MAPQNAAFGEFLYGVRQERGWTLREAAGRAGISFSRLGEIERGLDPHTGKAFVPSYVVVLKLARAYGLPPTDLLARAGHEPGGELEPEEWRLLSIFRGLSAARRERLMRVAADLDGEEHPGG